MTASAKRGKSGHTTPTAKPRFNLKAQVAKLGADSLLPPTKLTAAQKRKFHALVDGCGSRNQMERISARLSLGAFQREHGMDACQAAFNEETARRKKLRGEK